MLVRHRQKIIFKETFADPRFMDEMKQLVEVCQMQRLSWDCFNSFKNSLPIGIMQKIRFLPKCTWKKYA